MLDSIYSDQHYWDSFLGLESATKTKVVIRSMDLVPLSRYLSRPQRERRRGHRRCDGQQPLQSPGLGFCDSFMLFLRLIRLGAIAPTTSMR